MKKSRRISRFFRFAGSVVIMVLLLAVLTAATYAWFTSNRNVGTDKVNTRSGSATLELQVSQYGGTDFKGSKEAPITQVNQTQSSDLMPVSTADLKTFVYNPSTKEEMATHFVEVPDEKYYYHGRVYIQAVAKGQPGGSHVALYLDQGEESGGNLVSASDGLLLNATRLGLSFENTDPLIFRLSDTENNEKDQVRNTVLNNQKLADGKVLNGSGGTISQADDPSVALSTYTIKNNGTDTVLPEKPLMNLELNRIYPLDIYFYLEGCDPDCSNSVSYDGADLHLAFYGILTQ